MSLGKTVALSWFSEWSRLFCVREYERKNLKWANSSITLFSAGECRIEKVQALQSLCCFLRVPARELLYAFSLFSSLRSLEHFYVSLFWSSKHLTYYFCHYYLVFWDRVSLYSSGWPWSQNLLASASWMLRFYRYMAHTQHCYLLLIACLLINLICFNSGQRVTVRLLWKWIGPITSLVKLFYLSWSPRWPETNIFYISILLLSLHEYFTCMYVSICTVCVSAARGEQTRT